jgi:hypothetical protein
MSASFIRLAELIGAGYWWTDLPFAAICALAGSLTDLRPA